MENKDKLLTVEYLMKWHELDESKAKSLLEFCDKHTIKHESCYGDGSIMFPKWLETQSNKVDKTMINMGNREEMHIKQMNAEENYMTTPISVLSYITALEEQNKALLDEIERLKTDNRILKDELEDLDKQYSVLNDQFIKTKEWNLEIVYSNKFKDNEIEQLKFQLKAADSVNDVLEKLRTSDNEAWSKQCAEWMTKHEQIWNECLSANNKIDELEKLLLNK